MDRHEILIHDLIVWIDYHLRQPLKIEEVAQRAGYSKWHLQRIFQRIMHISLGNYIRDKKLALAAEDLINSNDPVIDISMKYGYDSQQSFTRSFVRKYRVPPATWRRLNAQKFPFQV